jgi:uncharacterized membrane protein
MSDSVKDGGDGAEERLAALEDAVRALDRRVDAVEERVGSRPATEPPREAPQAARPRRQSLWGPSAPRLDAAEARPAPVHEPERARPPAKSPPRIPPERLPVLVLGVAGGVALLVGLLYFVWHAIKQGWISPELRIVSSGAFSLAAMGGAWWLAGRGQRTVGAALGGVGLGGWFATVLVARHVFEDLGLLGPAGAFVLLAAGAAIGLLLADQRRLRLCGILAALGAVATPFSVGATEGGLAELAVYQLVLAVLLYGLELRRRWPELGHIAVVSTWIVLPLGVVGGAGGTSGATVVTWSVAFLLLGYAQSWNLLRLGRLSGWHAAPRLWVNGYAAWIFAMDAAGLTDTGEGILCLSLAALGAGASVALARVGSSTASARWAVRAGISGTASVAWLQVFVAGPLLLERDGQLVWWTVMAAAAYALHVWKRRVSTALPITLPYVAALVLALEGDGALYVTLAFLLAAMPLVSALLPGRTDVRRRGQLFDGLLAMELTLGAALWCAAAHAHLEGAAHEQGLIALVCLVAAAVSVARVSGAATPARSGVQLFLLAGMLGLCASFARDLGLFVPTDAPGLGADRAWQVGVLGGVAALAVLLELRLRTLAGTPDERWATQIADTSGLLRPAALLSASMLLVTAAVGAWLAPEWHESVNQAGWSVCMAVAGLSLLLRGLKHRRRLWRTAGMVVLFGTAWKVVAVDLERVAQVWRVLSFAGLGLCLLIGAYAYRRVGSWIDREEGGGEPPTD